MTVSSHEVQVPMLDSSVLYHTAHVDFRDYDRIFAFAKWKAPVSYEAYHLSREPEGIKATYADGTFDMLSFCQMRDVIERNWEYMRGVLQEKDGEDLGNYNETIGDHETLTLRCSTINFRISDSRGVALDRIWGTVRYEYEY